MLPAILAPVLTTLASNGLNLLAGAIQAKGKQVIEEKLGVSIEDAAKTEAGLLKLKQLEFEHEQFLADISVRKAEIDLEAEKVAQVAVTNRWEADMLSDSWLSKNVRPMILLYLLGAYTVLSVSSGFGFTVTQAYVELLGQMLMMAFSAYFVGRTVEKWKDMSERGKS